MTKEMAKEKRYAFEYAYTHGDGEVCDYIMKILENSNFHTFARLLSDCKWELADKWIEDNFN